MDYIFASQVIVEQGIVICLHDFTHHIFYASNIFELKIQKLTWIWLINYSLLTLTVSINTEKIPNHVWNTLPFLKGNSLVTADLNRSKSLPLHPFSFPDRANIPFTSDTGWINSESLLLCCSTTFLHNWSLEFYDHSRVIHHNIQ